MIYLIFSVLLFGSIYPGSRYFLNMGMGTLEFCFLFLLVRVLTQVLLWIFKRKSFELTVDWQFWIQAALIGFGMHYFEFRGLELGLDIGVNAFLVFCHPLWGLFLRRVFEKRVFARSDLWQVMLGMLGVLLIVGPGVGSLSLSLDLIIYPILGGVSFAFWVLLSEKWVEDDSRALGFSLRYDFITLLTIGGLLIAVGKAGQLMQISSSLSFLNWLSLALFGIAVGILPNIFFYMGVHRTGGVTSSFILLFEPVIATSLAWFLYEEELSLNFLLGALAILTCNLPSCWLKKITTLSLTQLKKSSRIR